MDIPIEEQIMEVVVPLFRKDSGEERQSERCGGLVADLMAPQNLEEVADVPIHPSTKEITEVVK